MTQPRGDVLAPRVATQGDAAAVLRMSAPLTIALVCSVEGAEEATVAFELDMLRAALTAASPHRFVVYPDTKVTRAAVQDTGMATRVTFVKAVRKPRLPRRFWRRAKRLVRRRAAPLPFAALHEALVAGGATCAWILGDTIAPIDLPYAAPVGDLRHRLHPWFLEVGAAGAWRERERWYEEFVRRASLLLAASAANATALRDVYGAVAGGPAIVPTPTPVFALEASWRSRSVRPNDVPSRYLLYVAPFAAHRNHITAVRVIAALEAGAAPPSLVLVGADRGTQAHVLAEAESLRVAGRLRIYPEADRDRLVSLYEHAEALLHPSLFDAYDQSPLAAMALGCPVIAASVNGADERVGDVGMMVDAFDVAGYAAAVRSLRHDPALRMSMTDRGLARAREWTPAQSAEAVLDLMASRIGPIRALWK